MKITLVVAIGFLAAGAQTGQAQNYDKQNCCPVTNASGQLTDVCFENFQRDLIRGEVFGLLGQFKTLVAEIHANTGTWPAPGDPNYVAAPTSYAQNWVSRFDLLSNGVLSVGLNRQAGGGSIQLHPVVPADPRLPLYWQCKSPDRPLIGQLVPGCMYSGLNP